MTSSSKGSGGGSSRRKKRSLESASASASSSSSSATAAAAPAAAAAAAEGSTGPSPPKKKAAKAQAQAQSSGVTILHAPADAEPISHEAPDVFERLLAPLTCDGFLQAHYAPKRPLVVRGHNFGPLLAGGMEGGDAAALLEATPSEAISVWTVDGGMGGKIRTARVQDPGSAAALWRAGHSVYCRAPEPVERALVDAAVRALGLGFRTSEEGVKAVVEGEVELFLGRKGHRTPWHFDFQENWTLQLRGRKRWRLRPGVVNPVRGCTPHYAQAEGVLDAAAEEQLKVHRLRDPSFQYGPPLAPSDQGEGEMEMVLEPGDVLYHPAGVWHAVDCVGGDDSVSINISIDGLTYADHIAGALRQALMAHAPFTALVQTGAPPQASVQRMAGLLREAARALEGLAAAPDALLPPCVLWGQPLPPLEPADVEVGGEEDMEMEMEEEEEVEDKGSEAGSDGGDDSEEEEEKEDLGQTFPYPVAPTAVLRRSPLAALFALDDTVPDDDDDEDGGDGAAREGTEAFMVHFAFGAGEELASVLRKKVVLRSALGRAVAGQSVGARFAPGAVEGGGTLEGRRALGALVHLGVLLDEAGEGAGGQEPARKKGRT